VTWRCGYVIARERGSWTRCPYAGHVYAEYSIGMVREQAQRNVMPAPRTALLGWRCNWRSQCLILLHHMHDDELDGHAAIISRAVCQTSLHDKPTARHDILLFLPRNQ